MPRGRCSASAWLWGLHDAGFAALTALYREAARGPITGITLIAGFASTLSWPLSTVLNDAVGWRETCLAWAAFQSRGRVAVELHAPAGRDARGPARGARGADRVAAAQGNATAGVRVRGRVVRHRRDGGASPCRPCCGGAGAGPVEAIAAASLVGPAQVAARLVELLLLRRIHPLVSARIARRRCIQRSARPFLPLTPRRRARASS